MKDGKINWTLSPNAPKDNIVSISFSPELEDTVKQFMIKLFGIRYLQAEMVLSDGLIHVKFEGDPDDVELANECLKRFYWEQNKITIPN